MSSYKLLEIYRLIQAYNIPWKLNFQTVYENPEKTPPRTRPRNNRNFLGNSAHTNAMGQFASPWPFTGWCGSNCILSPCLWLYLLEQPLYLKIWTTFQNIRRCFHIEFREYFLVGLLADIMAIAPDGMYYAHLVENIFDLLVSTFVNKKRNFFLQEHWEQISFVTNFNILGFGQPFFPADCRQSGKEWLNLSLCKPFVSGTFLNYLCFWSFSCPLRPQKDLVSCLFVYQHQIVRWGKTWLSR